MRLEISRVAQRDLDRIASYIALDNPDRADTFITELVASFDTLLDHPMAGRARDDLLVGLRSKPFGRYVIFYRATHNAIRIVRVVAGARDVSALFR